MVLTLRGLAAGSATSSAPSDETEPESLSTFNTVSPQVVSTTTSTYVSNIDSTTIGGEPSHDYRSGGRLRDKLNMSAAQQASHSPDVSFCPVIGLPDPQAKTSPPTPRRARSIISRDVSFSSFFKRGFPEPPQSHFWGRRSVSPSPVGKLRRKLSFGFARSITRPSSVATSMTASPEIKGMIKEEPIPDLYEVNRKLETVTSQTYQKLLQQAMQELNKGNPEICRSKCVIIVQSFDADVETKVYAYNILATQASAGQSGYFLNESAKLVKGHKAADPDLEKLADAIEFLRLDVGEREM